MPGVETAPDHFAASVQTLIIGAGAGGLVAALSAHDAGQDVLVLEADALPSGSTALSAGLIPAAGTKLQQAANVRDSAAEFAADIQAKAKNQNDPALVALLTEHAAETMDWLADTHGLPFSLVDDFDYPGHSHRRMHGLPSRSGRELMDSLINAAEQQGIDIICNARVSTLFVAQGRVKGVALTRPDGSTDQIGCDRLVLACNGFGGNRDMVRHHMPEIDGAVWFGHDGNQGDALAWGDALGAQTHHLGAYQGHGNVAHPHGILITWAVITEGGVQVNRHAERFWDESQGYSEAARAVLSQPGGEAFAIFDSRIAGTARQFADFRQAEKVGAIRTSDTIADLARQLDLPPDNLQRTVSLIPQNSTDAFGRRFSTPPLSAPFCGVRVTGALFHTQGGLVVDDHARVTRKDGGVFENLHAIGGAACGVSGAGDAGYLSGNGLLSAVVLGRIAGRFE